MTTLMSAALMPGDLWVGDGAATFIEGYGYLTAQPTFGLTIRCSPRVMDELVVFNKKGHQECTHPTDPREVMFSATLDLWPCSTYVMFLLSSRSR